MPGTPLPWDFLVILLALGILVPWRGYSRVRALLRGPQLSTVERISIYASTIAFQWVAAGITAWRAIARGMGPDALGLVAQDAPFAVILGAVLAAALGSLQYASLRQLSRTPPEKRGHLHQVASRLMPQNLTEALPYVALVCTVSLCEEFLYRGFAFAVFREVAGGSAGLAVILSSALFALGHAYQGLQGVANTFVLGMLLAATRAWSGSLVPPILAHLVVDLVAGLAGPRLMARKPQRRTEPEPPSIT
jgi:membrane protease YdiL (CAAX protease family)